MKLSIIITSYKNPELLKVCIDTIKKELAIKDYEIIVSDSDTDEKSEMMMREDYPDIIYIPFRENVGFQHLVRYAYQKSSGDYILILNGDIIVKKSSIESLFEFVKDNPDVGIAGPQLLNFNDTLQYSCFRYYTPLTIVYRRTFLGKLSFAKKNLDNFLMKDFNHSEIKEVDWIMGSALMTSRKAVEKVGLMDNRFKMYMEDTDWCRRFWENGLKVVYYPYSKMYHYHGRGSTGKNVLASLFSNRLTWMHIGSAIKFFIKYSGKPNPRIQKQLHGK
jgi:GT2 family glycosyltransferase